MTNTTASTPEDALDGVELIKPGRAVSMAGVVVDFSAEMVADIVSSYDPALHEAPHVKGHPTTDAPAFGWVTALSLSADGRAVLAKSRQVDVQFAEDVNAGRWKKRSLSLYSPSAPNNPKPGHWYAKHVGWLGATAPAIKGLRDRPFEFSEPESGVMTFGDWDDELNAGLWRRMREWFIGQFGAEQADKVIPAYEVDALQREAMRPEAEATPLSTTPAYAEGDPVPTANTAAADQAALQARQADLDSREAQLAQREQAQADLARNARRAGFASFCEGLVQQGRLLPAERPRILALMDGLPEAAEVVEFADGDPTKPVKTGAIEVLQGFLRSLPPRVDFAERAAPGRTGAAVDLTSPTALAEAAKRRVADRREAGVTLSFAEALQAVVAESGQA